MPRQKRTRRALTLAVPIALCCTALALHSQDAAPTFAELAHLHQLATNFAQLDRYAAANAALAPPQKGRVVFYGDSITDAWGTRPNTGPFFPGKPYVNRGISGQTTAQMLIRFRQDVIDLHPNAVVILAGVNDIAGNTGDVTLAQIEDNLTSMAELAHANHIRVILASVLPAAEFPWRKGRNPAPKIRSINAWMQQYCAAAHDTYLDYYTPLTDASGGMKPGLSFDGVHPTAAGYAIMAPLAETALTQAGEDHP